MNSNQMPDCKLLIYQYNENTAYYQLKQKPLEFNKLPVELKLEKTQRPDIIKSKYIIRGRVKNYKYTFFTGLLPTKYNNLYFGDYFERINGTKKNSFILFHFSNDQQIIKIYFFNHFKLYPKRRGKFINEFVSGLNKKGSEYPTPLFKPNRQTNCQFVQR